MVLLDITARYNPFEAFVFDFFMAQAVLAIMPPFRDALLSAAVEGSRLLDVGCGGGQLALELKGMRQDLHLTGLDLSRGQLRRARARSARSGAGLRLVRASALELPFADGSFDLVYSVDCLKHWPDRSRGLGECIRVLRPGGQLLITEINRECTLGAGMKFASLWRLPGFLKPFAVIPFFLSAALRSLTMDEARALARPFPLQDVSVEPGPGGINWTLKAAKPRDPERP
jgi:ubiquinone/menaquinone biosynthesis C-methylase UbiE